MAVRCMRCGNYVDGYSQMCDSCAAEKKKAEAAALQAAVEAATSICPSCSQEMPRAADSCPNCARSFVQTGAKFIPYTPADFFVRLVAWFIDTVGIVVVMGALIAATGSVPAGITIASLLWVVASVTFWMTLGATPGKLLMGIKIVTVDGDPVSIGHCVMRILGYIVINVFGNILYLLIAIKEDKRGLEDMMSGTMVVYRDTIPEAKPTTGPATAT